MGHILTVPILVLAMAALIIAIVFAPRWGLRQRLRARRAFRLRVTIEDALKHLHATEERGRDPSIESLAGALNIRATRAADVVRILTTRGLVTTDTGLTLTPAGERSARQVVRAHRLWERYLADELHARAEDLHRLADQHEHLLDTDQIEHLAADLGHPEHDPHGDPIPAVDLRSAPPPGWPLTLVSPGVPCEVVHLEDEPETVFARLVDRGLEVGTHVAVAELTPDRIALDIEGERCELSPVDAANVFVVPERRAPRGPGHTLADLREGERGHVRRVGVSGFARRRLFDLGFTPGALVESAFPAAFGEPRAYRIRGTVIALRPDQARRIEIDPLNDEARST